MKFTSFLVPAAFLSTLLLSARLPGDTLHFAPSSDAGLSKTFSIKGDGSLDDMVAYVNGEEQDPAMMGMPDELTLELGYELGITDHFASVADGRPTDFTRSFDSFRGWAESSEGDSSEEGMDDLVGKTARFVWDEEEGSYERSFVDDEEADAEDLAMVSIDMDLRALLPESEVAEGDEWIVTGVPVLSILVPGVDFEHALEERDAELFEDMPEELLDSVMKTLEGIEVVCTYKGTADQDGVTVAIIEVACTIDDSISIDPSALGGDEGGAEMEGGSLEIAIELEVTGECVWDVAGGHFSTFDADCTGTVGVELTMSVPDMFELEGSAEFSLDLAHSYSASAE